MLCNIVWLLAKQRSFLPSFFFTASEKERIQYFAVASPSSGAENVGWKSDMKTSTIQCTICLKVTHHHLSSSRRSNNESFESPMAQFGLHHHHHPSCMTITKGEAGTSCFHCSTTFINTVVQTRRQAQKVVYVWIKQICIWISRDVSLA